MLRQEETIWVHSCSLALDNGSETQTNEFMYLNPRKTNESLSFIVFWSFHISKQHLINVTVIIKSGPNKNPAFTHELWELMLHHLAPESGTQEIILS